ncbi:MAG TPA: hypothetical protein VMZ27_08950 [Candidatus Saccharimonadales bacterium]|nr:hypothetical protein [Candidatus Saccharimonadales bacterium]
MIDYFQLLQEPRRPWLDPEALRQKFLEISSSVHPDRTHNAPEGEKTSANDRYIELNAAYQTLRAPKERLLHLLTLELGSKPKEVQTLQAGAMDLFLQVAGQCRETDLFLAERERASSPLLKVTFFQKAQDWTEKLQALAGQISTAQQSLEDELRSMNRFWEDAPPVGSRERVESLPLARLEEIYRSFSYINKWSAQLQERVVQLSF